VKLLVKGLLIVISAGALAVQPQSAILVLEEGTLIDVSHLGRSTADIRDAVVVIRDGRIEAVGKRGEVAFPRNAERLDVSSKFIVPGFIDGFAGLNSQAQANAYLYMGVTSIVGVGDGRRGRLLRDCRPSPRVFPLEAVQSKKDVREIDSLARSGVRVLLLHYPLAPEDVRQAVRRARALGLATIGELGFTRYIEAADAGVQAFVHTSRYSLELAPPELRARVAAEPFGPPRTDYYRLLMRYDSGDANLQEYAKRLGGANVGLIPTLSLEYIDLPDHENPWKEPVARILDPKGIHLPADPATGNREGTSSELFPEGFSLKILGIESTYARAGAKYLAGSGTSAFGTLPGISLHTELELLTRVGLTPRQALAAATANYAEVFGWSDVGSLKVGARADVVVLDENPVEDIRAAKRIHKVVLGGKVDRPRGPRQGAASPMSTVPTKCRGHSAAPCRRSIGGHTKPA